MAKPRKARVEGEATKAVAASKDALTNPVELARVVDDIAAIYAREFPEDWATIANWPFQHTLVHIAAKLRSLG